MALSIPRYAEPDAPTYAEFHEQNRRDRQVQAGESAMTAEIPAAVERCSDLLGVSWSVEDNDQALLTSRDDAIRASLTLDFDVTEETAHEALTRIAEALTVLERTVYAAARKAAQEAA